MYKAIQEDKEANHVEKVKPVHLRCAYYLQMVSWTNISKQGALRGIERTSLYTGLSVMPYVMKNSIETLFIMKTSEHPQSTGIPPKLYFMKQNPKGKRQECRHQHRNDSGT